jgi:hypothetical protein
MRLENEFGSVDVSLDTDANGTRLKIVDLRTGHVGFLDPFELATLAWLDKDALAPFFDPSRTRWKAIEAGDLDALS